MLNEFQKPDLDLFQRIPKLHLDLNHENLRVNPTFMANLIIIMVLHDNSEFSLNSDSTHS